MFTALVRPIIETIDRFGLKSYFMRKHKVHVTRFYTTLLQRQHKTDLAQKAQERFRRNKRTLFTFMDYDNVPWNRAHPVNTQEHQI